jgi:hypothetical protein
VGLEDILRESDRIGDRVSSEFPAPKQQPLITRLEAVVLWRPLYA